jgi:pyridoxine kinase
LGAPALPKEELGTLLVGQNGEWLVTTPELPSLRAIKGTGDVLTALFLGHQLAGSDAPSSLGKAVSGVYALVETAAQGALRELPLVVAQDQMIHPIKAFSAVRI